ncbi:MAG: allophanate hydrolase subunit 1 [Sphingorhabdus sp.]
MAAPESMVHICDDWISISLASKEAVFAAARNFSSDKCWTEIVPGIDSIALQFNPALMSPDEASHLAIRQLGTEVSETYCPPPAIVIPICYDAEFSPDRDLIAQKLALKSTNLSNWHTSKTHRVAMLGFMPGFAYLESPEECPAIGRLENPRQLVSAGSIGIIGNQSCIYSFDSPGGWPIIGRTPLRLFDPSRDRPALLTAGQTICFESITRQAFDQWPQGAME